MSGILTTESQVKDALGIQDWRHLSKDKLMSFISILPDVDQEVAIKIIEQFPEFLKTAGEMLNIMQDLCATVLADDKLSSAQSIKAYQQVLDGLSPLLMCDNLSVEDKKYVAEKMIEVADKISLKDTEGKEFKGKVLNTIGGVIFGLLVIGVSILGIKHGDNNRKP